ncbi:HD domain-containing protein [Mucilaginibacter ginsenosidivorax]|uniref:Phosphohydrolase n=1 Tax=Mucilaginibacter ginsenosidivorax TaxID=862126 RepID=A0A5B8VVH9_9SPHI|nr:HD domain-containing protein [Mucilaginibacter ginsenosidivorax]QEC74872.1 phosphohydrolase [Mucilaginibacter ginsenosidivorax]
MQIDKAGEFILDKIKRELPVHFYYHNATHAQDVYNAAKHLALGEGIDLAETTLLLTAALFHDSGFLCGQDDHESNSCKIAREYLPAFNYTDAEIAVVCDIIMATKIPQKPHNKLGEIICDADLDYLGRNDFFILSKRLFSELEITHKLKTEQEWDKQQVSFLKSHRYFTKTAVSLRAAEKEKHLCTITERLI